MASKIGGVEMGEDDPHKVSFRGQALKVDTVEDAQSIIDQIEKCDELLTLELSGNTFGVEAAEAIAHVLEEKKYLKNCLWSDMFTGRLRSEIPSILSSLCNAVIKANTHLVVLDLSDNAFGPDGIKAVEQLLTSPACYSLEELYFNNNGLGSGGEILAKALTECHKNASEAGAKFALKTFACGRNRIESDKVKPLAEAFKLLQTLEVIRMPQNGINHVGIAALAKSFESNPNLTEIDLHDNTFAPKGSKAISEVLPKLLKLRVVNFDDCLLRDEGAQILSHGFTKEHTHLEIVKLEANEIKTDGAIALTDIISTLPAIVNFNLNTNELGKDTIKDIRTKMKSAGKEKVLDTFSGDELDDGNSDYDPENVNNSQDGEDSNKDKLDHSLENATAKNLENNLNDPPTNEQVNSFLTEPSFEKFTILGNNCLPVILVHISRDKDAEIITDMIVRLSAIWYECEAQQLITFLVEILDAILAESTKNNSYFSSQFINYILVHMGMIKSEDKKFKPLDKLGPILSILSEIINTGHFSKTDKDTLLIFLQKPFPKLLESPTELSILIGRIFS
ncbi:Ran GTPase-activating protein 1 [Oopsacas minuta]|uniref:Ran GTPase-activating protein 1 n=1 Tax=Oopsacas minuta TaxID=111878 RepID=A0AAV7JTT6_9METZ|nr:Ran GTPase-activating protein 1 [Oopsacas minuta]